MILAKALPWNLPPRGEMARLSPPTPAELWLSRKEISKPLGFGLTRGGTWDFLWGFSGWGFGFSLAGNGGGLSTGSLTGPILGGISFLSFGLSPGSS